MEDERERSVDGGGAPRPPRRFPRRRALQLLGGLVAGAAVGLGGLISGCGRSGQGGDGSDGGQGSDRGSEPAADRVELPLERLPDGARVRITVGDAPVELRREGERIVARSLLCTHFGCTVAWHPERRVYVCPCHEGTFAPDGRVLGGPPSRPLPELPVERVDGAVIVWAPGGPGGGEGA